MAGAGPENGEYRLRKIKGKEETDQIEAIFGNAETQKNAGVGKILGVYEIDHIRNESSLLKTENTWYHETRPENADSILRDNFDTNRIIMDRFGLGVSFGKDVAACYKYGNVLDFGEWEQLKSMIGEVTAKSKKEDEDSAASGVKVKEEKDVEMKDHLSLSKMSEDDQKNVSEKPRMMSDPAEEGLVKERATQIVAQALRARCAAYLSAYEATRQRLATAEGARARVLRAMGRAIEDVIASARRRQFALVAARSKYYSASNAVENLSWATRSDMRKERSLEWRARMTAIGCCRAAAISCFPHDWLPGMQSYSREFKAEEPAAEVLKRVAISADSMAASALKKGVLPYWPEDENENEDETENEDDRMDSTEEESDGTKEERSRAVVTRAVRHAKHSLLSGMLTRALFLCKLDIGKATEGDWHATPDEEQYNGYDTLTDEPKHDNVRVKFDSSQYLPWRVVFYERAVGEFHPTDVAREQISLAFGN